MPNISRMRFRSDWESQDPLLDSEVRRALARSDLPYCGSWGPEFSASWGQPQAGDYSVDALGVFQWRQQSPDDCIVSSFGVGIIRINAVKRSWRIEGHPKPYQTYTAYPFPLNLIPSFNWRKQLAADVVAHLRNRKAPWSIA